MSATIRSTLFHVASLLLVAIPAVLGGCCPNACNGHGACEGGDACACFPNWQSYEDVSHAGDCNLRSCPYELAWADAPTAGGDHHYYAECANKGTCNRSTGECECYPGYEGKGCGRMSCPDNCSGHGRCMFADEVGVGVNIGSSSAALGETNGNDAVTHTYHNWDQQKSRICVCDPGYQGLKCSLRSCPHGVDVMTEGTKVIGSDTFTLEQQHVQLITLTYNVDWAADAASGNPLLDAFALTFTTKTGHRYTTDAIDVPAPGGVAGDNELGISVREALLKLPGNVIDAVTVADADSQLVQAGPLSLTVTFTGTNVQGRQNLLEVEHRKCVDAGCSPMLTGMELDLDPLVSFVKTDIDPLTQILVESTTCGGRGTCEYETGECRCFSGYYGAHCETQTSLI